VKTRVVVLSLSMVSIFSSGSLIASEPGDMYAGIQYSSGAYNEDGFDEVKPTMLVGKYGKYINSVFSMEGRLGLGLQDDSIKYFGTELTLDIDSLIGVYGIGNVNLNESSSVYGLIGFTRAEATVSASGFGSDSSSESGLSFGVGANLGVSDSVSLNLEYTQYLNKSDFDLSAIALGVTFGF